MARPAKTALYIMALLAAALTLFADPARSEVHTRRASVMGTEVEVTVMTDDPERAERAFDAAFREIERVDSLMSEWKEGTPLARVNGAAGRAPVEVPAELYRVIEAALEVSRLTGGAFDVTWAAMWGLWDFRPGRQSVPDPAEVGRRLPLVDWRKVELDPERKTVFLMDEGMVIGLGGIAKGYSVDMAAAAVMKTGVEGAIVRAGGDMRVQGEGPAGGWPVGTRHPRKKDGLLASLTLRDVSISTSGDYERFFIKDGVRYHHIMDPGTGYPAEGVMSATVLAPDTMTSDALSTAVFVLGPEKGVMLAELLKGVEAIIVTTDGSVVTTSGIEAGSMLDH